ncbi:uncharacterized protein At3g17950 [Triticum aestivum]|nr:uncharacterized protein At3g17950-like [Triticum aestivum]
MGAQWSRALALWSHRSYQTPTSAGSHHRTGTGSLLRNHVAVTARPHTPNPDQLPPAEHHAQLLINPSSSSSPHHHRPSPLAPSVPLPPERAMDLDDDMVPYSPSGDSSPSSSDLDTESTGSFFPDRSTTLGTLMGVSTFGGAGVQRRLTRAAPGQESERPTRAATEERDGRRAGGWRRRRRRRGGSWWRLCRDDASGPPTRLGEFLDMERQHAGADFLCGGGGPQEPEAPSVAATPLFEDGRVRPPQPRAAPPEERGRWRLQRAAEGSSTSSSLARLPVLLTGICSGGAG